MDGKKIVAGALTLAGLGVAGTLLAGDFGTIPWMVNRATGIVAFGLPRWSS